MLLNIYGGRTRNYIYYTFVISLRTSKICVWAVHAIQVDNVEANKKYLGNVKNYWLLFPNTFVTYSFNFSRTLLLWCGGSLPMWGKNIFWMWVDNCRSQSKILSTNKTPGVLRFINIRVLSVEITLNTTADIKTPLGLKQVVHLTTLTTALVLFCNALPGSLIVAIMLRFATYLLYLHTLWMQ